MEKKKPKRLYSAVAMLGGVVLLMFEISRWSVSSPEKWFWAMIAVLMIVLGLAGVLLPDPDNEGR